MDLYAAGRIDNGLSHDNAVEETEILGVMKVLSKQGLCGIPGIFTLYTSFSREDDRVREECC